MTSSSIRNRIRSVRASLLACVLAFTLLSGVVAPVQAYAVVEDSDVIAGMTVKERGYTQKEAPSVTAKYCLLVDKSGNVFFSRSEDTEAQIASLTKIMTAIVVLDNDPELTCKVTVTPEAAQIGESSAELKAGDVLSMKDALTAMMVASGNDAASAIGTSFGAYLLEKDGKSSSSESACTDRFVAEMNAKAAELGLSNTEFANPHGLDYDKYSGTMYSTAKDLGTEVTYAMKNDTFRDIVKQPSATITVKRETGSEQLTIETTDETLKSYKGCNGVKTGFTELAGACYAGSAVVEDDELYAIILNATDRDTRFQDATTLWNWYAENKTDYKLINCDKTYEATIKKETADYPLVAEVAHADWIDKTIPATVNDPDKTLTVYAWDGNISQSCDYKKVTGGVKTGDVVGTITFKQHNDEIATLDLIALEDVPAPNFFEGIGIWWDRLSRDCNGEATMAESECYNKLPLLLDKSSK